MGQVELLLSIVIALLYLGVRTGCCFNCRSAHQSRS